MKSISRALVLSLALACLTPMQASQAQSLTTLYRFTDILDPRPILWDLVYYQGDLYGTSFEGGNWDLGTVFKVPRTGGSETILHSFYGGADGALPFAALTYAKGQFYGTAASNGANEVGFVFAMDATGNMTQLYNFTGGADGAYPEGTLAYHNGSIYGVTVFGGSAGAGTLFRLDPVSRVETVLHSFDGASEGANPAGGPYYYLGNLYGTTSIGGSAGHGVLYRLNATTGAFTILHNFGGDAYQGDPAAALIYCKGALYGITTTDGSANVGTVYKLVPSTGTVSVVYNFNGGMDGASPYGRLTQHGGILYGTTSGGGIYSAGTIFKLDPVTGIETVLYSFTGIDDGSAPISGLTYYLGAFYGTTGASAGNRGTVYKFVP